MPQLSPSLSIILVVVLVGNYDPAGEEDEEKDFQLADSPPPDRFDEFQDSRQKSRNCVISRFTRFRSHHDDDSYPA
jgi:hypothetical protein